MTVACGPMNLLELRDRHPEKFYRQDWYIREAFMRTLPDPDRMLRTPKGIIKVGKVPPPGPSLKLPSAVDLAHAFLASPDNPLWQHFFWCSDTDALKQRIFVGGVSEVNGFRFEIHRHLAITQNWGIPVFR